MYTNGLAEVYTGDVSKQYQASTVFGRQLVCIAEYWLAQNCKEEIIDQKSGACVGNFINEYHGGNYPKYEAWCAIFPWYCIEQASKALGCGHSFPGYNQTYGNAAKTVSYAGKYYKINKTPEVGSVFYRKSESGASSGHMGIVVITDQSRNVFYTIEGNIKLADGAEGVGAWKYSYGEITTRSFQFIHVELNPCNAQQAVDYKGWACNKAVIAQGSGITGKVATGATTTTTSAGSSRSSGQTQESGGETAGGGNNAMPTDPTATQSRSTTKEPTAKECETIILKIPPMEAVPHFSVIKDTYVANDITGGNTPNNAIRNGAVFNYLTSTKDTGRETGFGIFRDKAGNTVFILDAREQPAQAILGRGTDADGKVRPDMQLIGPFYHLIRYQGYSGDGFKEKNAKMISGEWEAPLYTVGNGTEYAVMTELTMSVRNLFMQGGPGYASGAIRNIPKLLEIIEKKSLENTAFRDENSTKPYVIILEIPQPAPALRALSTILAVSSAMVGFLKIPGLDPEIVKSALTPLQKLSSGQTLGLNDFLSSIGSIANLILPEKTKKGLKSYFDEAKGYANSLIKDAALEYNNVAKSLGVTFDAVKNIYERYEKEVKGAFFDAQNLTNGLLSDVNKTMFDLGNMLMIKKINKTIASSSLLTAIKDSSITQVPIMQDMLLAGNAETVLPAIPELNQIVASLMKKDPFFDTFLKSGKYDTDLQSALIGAAFGYIPPKNVFDKWVLDAMAYQVESAKAYVIPPSIPEEKAACFRYELERRTGQKIIHCPDGWEYDQTLGKCKNKTTSVVVEKPSGGGTTTTTPGGGGTTTTTPGNGSGGGSSTSISKLTFPTLNMDLFTIPSGGGGSSTIPKLPTTPDIVVNKPPVEKLPTTPVTTVPYTPVITTVEKPPEVKIPETPVIPLPPCVEILSNKYYVKIDAYYYQASVTNQGKSNEKWTVNYKGQWLELVDCHIEEPPPVQEVPEIPEVTITKKPEQPTIPSVPVTRTPEQPTIPSVPVTRTPEQPTIPSVPVTRTPEQPAIPDIPTNKAYPPKYTNDCGCELTYPKFVEERKKIFYQYPKGDEHCCGEGQTENCDEC